MHISESSAGTHRHKSPTALFKAGATQRACGLVMPETTPVPNPTEGKILPSFHHLPGKSSMPAPQKQENLCNQRPISAPGGKYSHHGFPEGTSWDGAPQASVTRL